MNIRSKPNTLLKQLFFIIMICKQQFICGSEIDTYVYDRTSNVRMEHVYMSTMTSSKIVCGSKCGNDVNCISANYQKSTGTCELSTLPSFAKGSNSVVDSNWITMSKTSDISEWFLVFLGVAGNGVDIYDAWINGTDVTTDDVNCMQLNFNSCRGLHYRNKVVDFWDNLNIKKVRYSHYKNNQEVAYVTFDGEGHSIDSWFTNNSIIASSWTDIQSQTFNYFSIEGYPTFRRFLINMNFGGCPYDRAYAVIVTSDQGTCVYDTQDSYPQFLYSDTSSSGYPEGMIGFDKADAVTIHIKT